MSTDVYPKVKPRNVKDASGRYAPEAETTVKGGCVCVPDMRLIVVVGVTTFCCWTGSAAAGDSVDVYIVDADVGEFVGR